MNYYGNNDFRDYMSLTHHGILGMKWGKRNGPPYPLGASDHSASEKKAGWRQSLADGREARIKKRRDRYVAKESVRAEKRYDSEIDHWKKKAQKTQEKIDKELKRAREKGSYNKVRRLEGAKTQDLFNQYVAEGRKAVELKKIKNMSVSDVSSEKKKVAKDRARAALITVGGAAMIVAGSPVYTIGVTDSRAIKTKNRISGKDDSKIQVKAFIKAQKKTPASQYSESVKKYQAYLDENLWNNKKNYNSSLNKAARLVTYEKHGKFDKKDYEKFRKEFSNDSQSSRRRIVDAFNLTDTGSKKLRADANKKMITYFDTLPLNEVYEQSNKYMEDLYKKKK